MELIPAVALKLSKKAGTTGTKVLYRTNNTQTNQNVFWTINADGGPNYSAYGLTCNNTVLQKVFFKIDKLNQYL